MRHVMPMFNRLNLTHCHLCNTAPALTQQVICQGCLDDLPYALQPFDVNQIHIQAMFDYAWPVDRLIHLFKYRSRLDLLPLLVHPAYRLSAPPVDALVAVPMSDQRLRERGFNHAHLLAQALSKIWQIPLWHGVIRQRDTHRQQSLDWLDRLDNLHQAFALTHRPPAHIMLIDDVLTTGSTLSRLAELFLQQGSQTVCASVIASAHQQP